MASLCSSIRKMVPHFNCLNGQRRQYQRVVQNPASGPDTSGSTPTSESEKIDDIESNSKFDPAPNSQCTPDGDLTSFGEPFSCKSVLT